MWRLFLEPEFDMATLCFFLDYFTLLIPNGGSLRVAIKVLVEL